MLRAVEGVTKEMWGDIPVIQLMQGGATDAIRGATREFRRTGFRGSWSIPTTCACTAATSAYW
jgi:hypothetical protein